MLLWTYRNASAQPVVVRVLLRLHARAADRESADLDIHDGSVRGDRRHHRGRSAHRRAHSSCDWLHLTYAAAAEIRWVIPEEVIEPMGDSLYKPVREYFGWAIRL